MLPRRLKLRKNSILMASTTALTGKVRRTSRQETIFYCYESKLTAVRMGPGSPIFPPRKNMTLILRQGQSHWYSTFAWTLLKHLLIKISMGIFCRKFPGSCSQWVNWWRIIWKSWQSSHPYKLVNPSTCLMSSRNSWIKACSKIV